MTLIDGDKIVTANLYDDEHEEFTEKKMSIIDYVNAYTDEGVTTADDVLYEIRSEIEQEYNRLRATRSDETLELGECLGLKMSMKIIDKYKAESEVQDADRD